LWSECEGWSRDHIENYQLAALQRQLGSVAQRSAYYHRIFAAHGFDPRDLKTFSDLRRLPITRKTDYLASLAESPPWGSLLACDPAEIGRVHFSSGTSAMPVPACWTNFDLDRWADLYARYFFSQGVRSGDLIQIMYGFPWFVGGLGVNAAARRLGAGVIPGGSGDSKRQIETIFRLGPKVITGTPSFVAHLGEMALEMGYDLRDSAVKTIGVGGEPGASVPGTRARIEASWGAKIYDCYGALECQPIGWETSLQAGPTLAEDFIYAEVLDPVTLEPVADGTPGVLVITHLDREACPLVRWWTGDVVVRDTRLSADGRTHARLPGGVRGRADDMLVIRGVNLFPSAVEDVLHRMPEVAGAFQIVIDDKVKDAATEFLTGFHLKVEVHGEPSKAIDAYIAGQIREQLKVRPLVETLPIGTLPRDMHKATRLIRNA
jgi:phenylacetate-CoA ligase